MSPQILFSSNIFTGQRVVIIKKNLLEFIWIKVWVTIRMMLAIRPSPKLLRFNT